MRTYLLVGILVIVFASCKKDQVSKNNHESLTAWIKLKPGSRWIYRVDSLAYRRDKAHADTFSFELMETVDTLFEDNVKQKAARIKIVIRRDSLDFWQFRRMYYAKITDKFYERVEENVRLLKLSFPPAEDAFWNLNSRNNLPPAMLSYRKLYEPFEGTYLRADSTLTVVGKEINNALEKFSYLEVYGKGIGMMYRENTEMLNQGGNWDGYKRTQKLVYAD